MNRTVTFDIETTSLINSYSIDYTTSPFTVRSNYKTHCGSFQDINTREVFSFFTDEDMIKFIFEQCDVIIMHNGVGFDLMSLSITCKDFKYWIYPDLHKRLSVKDPHEELPDRIIFKHEMKKVKIVDTLLMSKLLNPDRIGGHSLESWGKRVGEYKGDFKGPWDVFTPEMLEYNKQDVVVTTKTYIALFNEVESLYGKDFNSFWEAYYLEAAVRDIISYSEHYGFKFNKELAEWCVKDLTDKMREIENRVEPLLPDRELPKSQQLSLPKNMWVKFWPDKPWTVSGKLKKPAKDYLVKLGITDEEEQIKFVCEHKEIPMCSDCLSAHAISYGEKIGVTDKEELFKLLSQTDYRPPILTEKMRLAHDDDVKQYLVDQGWIPTAWNERDLTMTIKKTKKTKEDTYKTIDTYVEDTVNSSYCKFRCDYLGCVVEDLKPVLLDMYATKSRVVVITTPTYTIDQEKHLCPGLIALGDQYSYVQDIVHYLTYSHRKNTILSENGTGWLTHERVGIDGRIPTPADTMACNTSRFRHSVIVNCPKVSTLYGQYMRGMLGVDEDHYQLGADAAALENRVQGHYIYKYTGGVKDSEALIGEKPNDCHTLLANELGITRDEAKKTAYSLLYGCQPPKLSKQMGWSLPKSKAIFNGFWETKKALKELKTALTKHWEANNRKFIVGIDGRRLMSRAEHALLNLLFQATGAIAMKRAMIFAHRNIMNYGNPFHDNMKEKTSIIISMHDELQLAVPKNDVRFKYFEKEDDARAFVRDNDKFVFSEISLDKEKGMWYIAWCNVGEVVVQGLLDAGKYYNLNIPLTSEYKVGESWADCH